MWPLCWDHQLSFSISGISYSNDMLCLTYSLISILETMSMVKMDKAEEFSQLPLWFHGHSMGNYIRDTLPSKSGKWKWANLSCALWQCDSHDIYLLYNVILCVRTILHFLNSKLLVEAFNNATLTWFISWQLFSKLLNNISLLNFWKGIPVSHWGRKRGAKSLLWTLSEIRKKLAEREERFIALC